MSNWRIPLFDARFGPEEEEALLRPLWAGWLTMGEEVLRLEEELAAYTGARFALDVSNCTAALHMACAALNIGPDDADALTATMWRCRASTIGSMKSGPLCSAFRFAGCRASWRAAVNYSDSTPSVRRGPPWSYPSAASAARMNMRIRRSIFSL